MALQNRLTKVNHEVWPAPDPSLWNRCAPGLTTAYFTSPVDLCCKNTAISYSDIAAGDCGLTSFAIRFKKEARDKFSSIRRTIMTANELFQQAQRLFIEGRQGESIEKFTEALKAGFEPGITYLSRGAAYLKMNEPDKAIDDFTLGIEAHPEKANAYYYRGAAHMAKDEYEKAIADMDRAIELKPDYGAAIFARGMAKVNLGRGEEGAADIKTAMTHAEAEVQGFADTYGWRTQVEKVIAALEGERRPETMVLSDEEMKTLKKLLLPEEAGT